MGIDDVRSAIGGPMCILTGCAPLPHPRGLLGVTASMRASGDTSAHRGDRQESQVLQMADANVIFAEFDGDGERTLLFTITTTSSPPAARRVDRAAIRRSGGRGLFYARGRRQQGRPGLVWRQSARRQARGRLPCRVKFLIEGEEDQQPQFAGLLAHVPIFSRQTHAFGSTAIAIRRRSRWARAERAPVRRAGGGNCLERSALRLRRLVEAASTSSSGRWRR